MRSDLGVSAGSGSIGLESGIPLARVSPTAHPPGVAVADKGRWKMWLTAWLEKRAGCGSIPQAHPRYAWHYVNGQVLRYIAHKVSR